MRGLAPVGHGEVDLARPRRVHKAPVALPELGDLLLARGTLVVGEHQPGAEGHKGAVYVGGEEIVGEVQHVHVDAAGLQVALQPVEPEAVGGLGVAHKHVLAQPGAVRGVPDRLDLGGGELVVVHLLKPAGQGYVPVRLAALLAVDVVAVQVVPHHGLRSGRPDHVGVALVVLHDQVAVAVLLEEAGPLGGGNSIDSGLAQFRVLVMFGVLRHVSTYSALVLNLAQNAAQFGAQFGA